MIKVTEATPFPPNSNPYRYDTFNMGYKVATNVHIMFPCHDSERTGIMYVINTETGERIKIEFLPEEEQSFMGLAKKGDLE